MGVPFGLDQFGLITVLGSGKRRFKINQVERGEMLTLQVIDQVRCRTKNFLTALLHELSLILFCHLFRKVLRFDSPQWELKQAPVVRNFPL